MFGFAREKEPTTPTAITNFVKKRYPGASNDLLKILKPEVSQILGVAQMTSSLLAQEEGGRALRSSSKRDMVSGFPPAFCTMKTFSAQKPKI